jgi:hypothetical protein
MLPSRQHATSTRIFHRRSCTNQFLRRMDKSFLASVERHICRNVLVTPNPVLDCITLINPSSASIGIRYLAFRRSSRVASISSACRKRRLSITKLQCWNSSSSRVSKDVPYLYLFQEGNRAVVQRADDHHLLYAISCSNRVYGISPLMSRLLYQLLASL